MFKWIGNLIDGRPKEETTAGRPAPIPAPVAVEEEIDEPDDSDDSRLVVFEPDGSIQVKAASVDQAKLALKELKLRKKELAIAKKGVTAEAREIRAAATDRNRRHGAAVGGLGKMGAWANAVSAAGKAGDRQTLAKNLAPHEQQRAQFDRMILAVDKAIIQVETYIVRNGD